MKRIAVISVILEEPSSTQAQFNEVVSSHKQIVVGRMGLPVSDMDIAVISLTVISSMDEINSFTGKLGAIPNIVVKTAVSKREI